MCKTQNRGFAFVEYESHRAAALARRRLIPSNVELWGQRIAVDWAIPEQEVEQDIMLKVLCYLYLGSIYTRSRNIINYLLSNERWVLNIPCNHLFMIHIYYQYQRNISSRVFGMTRKY